MVCPDCELEMVPGVVLVPVWGHLDGRTTCPGDTVNHVGAGLANCMKCPCCGHSVSEEALMARAVGMRMSTTTGVRSD